MIRPLRRIHRLAMAMLTIALLVLFIAGLIIRLSTPPANNLPLNLKPASGGSR
jgi:hypothetical protein